MSHVQFAKSVYKDTNSQSEMVDTLLNRFLDLSEEQAERIAISVYEDYKAEQEYKGEKQFEIERGN